MKEIIFGVCLLMLSNFVFSQANTQLHQVKPKWKLGDQKRVHTESLSKMFVKDSLFNNTQATAVHTLHHIQFIMRLKKA